MKSHFLTEIAKTYDKRIDIVTFGRLPECHLGRVTPSCDRNKFFIDIDDKKSKCVFQTLFTLYHEVAHVVLFHFTEPLFSYGKTNKAPIEREADDWALREIGAIDKAGRINNNDLCCYDCLRSHATICLKKIKA